MLYAYLSMLLTVTRIISRIKAYVYGVAQYFSNSPEYASAVMMALHPPGTAAIFSNQPGMMFIHIVSAGAIFDHFPPRWIIISSLTVIIQISYRNKFLTR